MTDFKANHVICVSDPIGRGGDVYAMVKSLSSRAPDWGIRLNIKTFEHESAVVHNFKTGVCDAIAITGVKAHQFNKFTATIEAPGALPDYRSLKMVLEYLTKPELSHFMQRGGYEIAAVVPIGNVYAFVRDRQWMQDGVLNNMNAKKIGVLEDDQSAVDMVRQLGAIPLAMSLTSLAQGFNNGDLDVIFAPAIAYAPLKLYTGLNRTGGALLRFPLIQLTGQIVVRYERFPPGFALKIRKLAYAGRGLAMEYVYLAENRIPESYWAALPEHEVSGIENLMKEVRVKLGQEGVYDQAMLKIMKRARCQHTPHRRECLVASHN